MIFRRTWLLQDGGVIQDVLRISEFGFRSELSLVALYTETRKHCDIAVVNLWLCLIKSPFEDEEKLQKD